MSQLLKIKPHLRFYIENISFFTDLSKDLEARLDNLETTLTKNVSQTVESNLLKTLASTLPHQVQSQIESSTIIGDKISSGISSAIQSTLKQELVPLKKTVKELRDASDAAAFSSSADLSNHIKAFQDYCRDSNKNFATKADLASAQLGSTDIPAPATMLPKVKMPAPAEFSGKRTDWKSFMG